MNPAKQKSLDQIAADAGKFALRYADKMLYEMVEAVTDRIIPQGAEELGRGIVTQGLAFSPTANSLEPTDLPQHGDPSVWGAQIQPDIDTSVDLGSPPDATPGRDVEVGPDVLPPDPGAGVGPMQQLEPPTIDQPKTPEITGPDYKLLPGPPDAPGLPVAAHVPLLPSPSVYAMERIAIMPDKSFIQEVTDFAAAGRDEIVTALENPMQGFTAPEPEPDGPEPEPETDLEPDW